MYVDRTDILWKTLADIGRDEGLDLYEVERLGAHRLRVSVEKSKGGQGIDGRVTSGDCSRLCRRLMVFFAVKGGELGVASEPEVEISSPGVNRQLRVAEHFRGAVGERVRVTRCLSDSAGETVIGMMSRFTGEMVCVEEESSKREVEIPLCEVKRANVEFRFPEGRP